MLPFKKIAMLTAIASSALVATTAQAGISWQFNYADAYAADGAVLGPNDLAQSATMDEIKFTAESVIQWNGTPFATGSTFIDYIVLRVDQFFFQGGDVTDATYGQGTTIPGVGTFPGTHEITAVFRIEGEQTGTNTYSVFPHQADYLANFIFDAGSTNGGTYTAGNFASLNTLTDGTVVEQGIVLSGNGSNTTAGLPDGSIGLVLSLVDILGSLAPQGTAYDPFELYQSQFEMVLGIADGNNNLCESAGGTANCVSDVASILSVFGEVVQDGVVYTHTKTDGSMVKMPVPEPGSLALLGAAAFGFAGTSRRRKAA